MQRIWGVEIQTINYQSARSDVYRDEINAYIIAAERSYVVNAAALGSCDRGRYVSFPYKYRHLTIFLTLSSPSWTWNRSVCVPRPSGYCVISMHMHLEGSQSK